MPLECLERRTQKRPWVTDRDATPRCGACGASATADPGGGAEDAAGGASAGAQWPAEGAQLHPTGADVTASLGHTSCTIYIYKRYTI